MRKEKESGKKNFAMFEKAMGVFNPYSSTNAKNEAANQDGKSQDKAPDTAEPAVETELKSSDIETLKAELTAMQNKLDRLTKSTS